jgi:hypothetical protein
MPSTAAGRYPDRMSLQWDPDGPARGRVVLHRDQPDRWLESVSAFADTTLGS